MKSFHFQPMICLHWALIETELLAGETDAYGWSPALIRDYRLGSGKSQQQLWCPAVPELVWKASGVESKGKVNRSDEDALRSCLLNISEARIPSPLKSVDLI